MVIWTFAPLTGEVVSESVTKKEIVSWIVCGWSFVSKSAQPMKLRTVIHRSTRNSKDVLEYFNSTPFFFRESFL